MLKTKKKTIWQEEPTLYTQQVPYVPYIENSYYNDINYYLQHGTTPSLLNATQKKSSKVEIITILVGPWNHVQKNYDRVLLHCLEKKGVDKFIKDLNDGPVGGHFYGDTTTHKILRARYY
jgi:hypothetical protein